MKTSDFDYELPEELIAQYPASERKQSRMLVMDGGTAECVIRHFYDFPHYVTQHDCVVFNDTRVIPARLWGYRVPTGGKVEILLLEEQQTGGWTCMLRPGRRLRAGSSIRIQGARDIVATVTAKNSDGTYTVSFTTANVLQMAENCGQMPLPPYIRRAPTPEDSVRYQTVYACEPGGIAAPTAGLHFTDDILNTLQNNGVSVAQITLHPGPGTFKPVESEHVEEHRMHEESYTLTPDNAETINSVRKQGGRVFAVGTTTVRVLETCFDTEDRKVHPGKGRTDLFLHPPKTPQAVDALLTNFHLPRSTLLMLVSTFSTRENVLYAYSLAVRERMRFYSYGDCMLLI